MIVVRRWETNALTHVVINVIISDAAAVRQIEGTSTKAQVPQILWSRGTGNIGALSRALHAVWRHLSMGTHGRGNLLSEGAAMQRSEWGTL